MPISFHQSAKTKFMQNKNRLLLAGLCMLFSSTHVIAQEPVQTTITTTNTTEQAVSTAIVTPGSQAIAYGGSYNVLDTNYVPAFRMDQHRKFLNYQYNFPAKPRNMWEIGVGTGLYNYSADVPTLMLWEGGGYGFHAHIRKSWGYMFSTRLQYIYGIAKGLQWQESVNYSRNKAWYNDGYSHAQNMANPNAYHPMLLEKIDGQPAMFYNDYDPIHYNYRSEAHQLSLDFMFNTNNISWHKARTGLSFYGFIGMGAFAYNTKVNVYDANGKRYNFQEIVGDIPQVHANRREIKRRLKAGMDNSYETEAETIRGVRRPTIFRNKTLDWAFSGGLGAQIKISKLVNISIEDRITFPHDDDLLDGQRWAEQTLGDPVFTQNNDMVNYFSIGVNVNVGNSRKNVEPLYWLNPLDYVYDELNAPNHLKVNATLPDSDHDGVTDQFDQCPGTPEGVPVDVNGCPLDTDGDGVPDYRDKQLITPTECQPVDEDGVGKCPCPDDCSGTAKVSGPCSNIGSGTIAFDNNASRIKPYNQARLASLAAMMKAHPDCKVVMIGAGAGSKIQQQRSWDRVDAIISYMMERHGIDRNRFIFQYGQQGDPNTVMYRSAMEGEDGPANVAPPFPNLRRD
ncbi:MAG: hypothetical protein JSS78_10490 [Bacteroidetes bacterium]|nr:hypothetical protein [Bacteroidota bacterium]